jgi:hypothetical protein
MTTSHTFVNPRAGRQFVRTAVSSVIAAVFAATLAFAPDATAQSDKPVAKKQIVSKATPARAQKVAAARKRASVQKVTTVQEDVRVQGAAPAEEAIAPQAAAKPETQLVSQKAAPVQTEVAAREPVATEQASTDAVAVKVAAAQPIQTEPAPSDEPTPSEKPETDPTQASSATFIPVVDPSVKAEPEGDDDCTVCHKRRQTLILPCQSLSYRRHVDHGDTAGACPPTVGSRSE